MISSQNSASSDSIASYVIAQFTPDMFRREPKNVGVVVEKSGYVAARFVGEDSEKEGGWDLRKLRWIQNPNAYRLWVDRWKKVIATSDDWQIALMSERSGNFAAIPGGDLLGTGTDTPIEVCDYLFGLLVSAGGLADAIPMMTLEEPQLALKNDIKKVFGDNGLFNSLFVAHPIYPDREIKGTSSWHRIAFYQEANHEAWAMEPIDFHQQHKNIARDHAAYTRWVFDDLRRRSETNGLNIHTVAVVAYDDPSHESVSKGLEILGTDHTILNWLDSDASKAFVDERVRIANAA